MIGHSKAVITRSMETLEEELATADQDRRQFMSLLEPIFAKLSRFTLALTRDDEEARDLVSDTIHLAFENFRSLREPQAFTSYLFTIAWRLSPAIHSHAIY